MQTNSQYWSGTGPVFFYIEGEGAGSPYDVVQGEHVELAQTYGALLVALEHRYYGASVPVPDLSTPNMRYLSSHQAIGDIAQFYQQYMVPTFNLTTYHKLVTYGGSYPGALSAWTRLRLPHIVHAALSTSSPIQVRSKLPAMSAAMSVCSFEIRVARSPDECNQPAFPRIIYTRAIDGIGVWRLFLQAVADFTGYNDVVAASLAKTSIGGSQAVGVRRLTTYRQPVPPKLQPFREIGRMKADPLTSLRFAFIEIASSLAVHDQHGRGLPGHRCRFHGHRCAASRNGDQADELHWTGWQERHHVGCEQLRRPGDDHCPGEN